MSEDKAIFQEFKLDPDNELRFEVEDKDEKVTLELKSGLAEVFGTELVKGKKYEFTCGSKIAVYTWQGCVVELGGKTGVSYVSKETPMSLYLNCHAAMERLRETAEKNDSRGPILMVVGPCDVGKSTLCRLLLNYAVRMGRRPIYVDLDVGQGHIAIPGTVGALLVERQSNVVDGFNQQAPLVFHYGHKSPQTNIVLYNLLVTRLAEVCSGRLQGNKKAKASGIVINTCGWVKGGGYKILTHAAQAFEVDSILVLDQERLYNDLARDMPDFVKVVFLPKSGGIVERSQAERKDSREQSIREYFYGSRTPLYPHNFEVKWSEAKLFKIGAPIVPTSCLPLGMKTEDNVTKLIPVTPGPGLLHHILSVSFADSPEDDVVQTNVAGFVCVTNVDVDRQTFTILSPQSRPLPNHILLLSEIQFIDTL
ncbi:protein CLP1 homolog [Trichogramma pretiosum]|uniref:Protein CLP1 homolog n=1 Tax=Trichogramma kaykai TaxID=54128 RepID=A0ABD2WYS8_9HYME|nr:protein CLP1 homolog [Trichogramma pretiosum]XP_023316354.1 protein CLP1 homolog [Trichogramma pretiosum]